MNKNIEIDFMRMSNQKICDWATKKKQEDTMSEQINHPAHYNIGKHEVIDVIEGQGWGEGFNLGNALKYITRAGHKDASTALEDLKKAAWYIEREIMRKRKISTDIRAEWEKQTRDACEECEEDESIPVDNQPQGCE
jgi:hypothetical protein